MTDIDWSKAPEGATHWQPENLMLRAAWIKEVKGIVYFWMPGAAHWTEYDRDMDDLGDLVPRPADSTGAWTGEGLPPVGEIIEWLDGKFLKAVVVGHHKGAVVAVDDDDPRRVFIGKKPCYRPFRTPEQIADEAREKAIAEMVEAIGNFGNLPAVSLFVICGILHDTGYQKTTE